MLLVSGEFAETAHVTVVAFGSEVIDKAAYGSSVLLDSRKLENDEKLMDAVIHNLTVIGEAANHIPTEITDRHTEIRWRQMVDLRNFSVHAYWNLRPSIIWDTIQNDLPPLVEPLRTLLQEPEE